MDLGYGQVDGQSASFIQVKLARAPQRPGYLGFVFFLVSHCLELFGNGGVDGARPFLFVPES